MILIDYPEKSQWQELLKRPVMNTESLFGAVQSIIDRVKAGGDEAVLQYELQFDKVSLSALAVSSEEFDEAEKLIDEELKAAIRLAAGNISAFHAAQRFVGKKVETQPGVTCWQKAVPIEKVGLYIPGGTAPLFSTVLMLAVPACIAGCREIVLCTPPGKEYPSGQGREGASGCIVCGSGGRCTACVQGRWCTGHCGDGLWDGKHPESI